MTTAKPVRPMRADARRNYERIVATAKEAFTERGPDVPLDDIAKRAGVGPGTLYRHFPDRDTLIEAVYRADIERLAEISRQLLETLPPEKALPAWMREQVKFGFLKRGLADTLKAAMERNSATFNFCSELLRNAAGELVTAAKDAGLVREDLTPKDLLRLGHAVVVAAERGTQEDADRYLEILLAGLKP